MKVGQNIEKSSESTLNRISTVLLQYSFEFHVIKVGFIYTSLVVLLVGFIN